MPIKSTDFHEAMILPFSSPVVFPHSSRQSHQSLLLKGPHVRVAGAFWETELAEPGLHPA